MSNPSNSLKVGARATTLDHRQLGREDGIAAFNDLRILRAVPALYSTLCFIWQVEIIAD